MSYVYSACEYYQPILPQACLNQAYPNYSYSQCIIRFKHSVKTDFFLHLFIWLFTIIHHSFIYVAPGTNTLHLPIPSNQNTIISVSRSTLSLSIYRVSYKGWDCKDDLKLFKYSKSKLRLLPWKYAFFNALARKERKKDM